MFVETGANPLAKNELLHLVSSIIQNLKKIYKNMRTTIIDVKFDEKSKSELTIG